jgi:hypothetical protein
MSVIFAGFLNTLTSRLQLPANQECLILVHFKKTINIKL